MDENLVVVNKPSSVPVHPVGRFKVHLLAYTNSAHFSDSYSFIL